MKKNKHDEWFFTGAKATYGTFNNADATEGDSINPPFTTDLADTGHGLIAGSMLYIQGSVNYNGLKLIKSLPDANSMLIYSKYVEEELAGTETWKTMITYDEIIQGILVAGSPFEFLGLEVTLDAAAATASENLTVTIDAARGSAFDNLIYSIDMNGHTDVNYMFDEPRLCAPGDKIDVAWANADTNTWGIKLFTRKLV